ncbi:hypothetical protein S245_023133 [Arachis hypogaea]|nr:uncharacterized protein LOC112703963 [Arachis hypogaea]XP_025611355.1 uncharacterized protein LOC112703964 [Arachis hypogaea]
MGSRGRYDPNKYHQWRPVSEEENQQPSPSLPTIIMEQEEEAMNKRNQELEQEAKNKKKQEQEQEAKNKKNQEQQSGSPVEERATVGGDGGAATASPVEERTTVGGDGDAATASPVEERTTVGGDGDAATASPAEERTTVGLSLFATQYPEYFGTRGYYRGPNHQSDSSKPNS